MPRKSKELINREMEGWEREARFNAAWGRYGATMRMIGFKQDVASHDRAIQQASSYAEREAAKKSKEEFLKDCHNSNGLHIGYY